MTETRRSEQQQALEQPVTGIEVVSRTSWPDRSWNQSGWIGASHTWPQPVSFGLSLCLSICCTMASKGKLVEVIVEVLVAHRARQLTQTCPGRLILLQTLDTL